MAVLALSVGIGATSAIFSVVHAVLLRPFPYDEPDRLVVVWETNLERGHRFMYASPPNFADWRDQNEVFDGIGGFNTGRYSLQTGDEPIPVQGAEITPGMLATLGVGPLFGRDLAPQDAVQGAAPVALISHRFWQARLGSDREWIGRTVRVDDEPVTIVGVMPPDFEFPPPIVESGTVQDRQSDVWLPFTSQLEGGNRRAHFMTVIGRLRQGVNHERAQEGMNLLAQGLAEAYPESNEGWEVSLVPLDEQVVGGVRSQILVLLGAVGFVLLIACINVSNLLLAKGMARGRELAVRSALGASRGRLLSLMLAESLVLALLAGALGLLLAYLGVGLLVQIAPGNLPRIGGAHLNLPVVGFALVVSLSAGALAGLAPALRRASVDLVGRLQEGGRGHIESRSGVRLRSALVAAEVGLSVVLLVGAGLLFQTLIRLRGVEAGFDPEGALVMQVTLPAARFEEPERRVSGYEELERRLGQVSGVQAAGFIYDVPLAADRQGTSFLFEGEPESTTGAVKGANFSIVTPGYFDALGIRVLRGRGFEVRDRSDVESVVVVNEALVATYLDPADPFGRRIVLHGSPRTIIGVVADVRHEALRDDPTPVAYLPYSQEPWTRSMSLVVRSQAGGAIQSGPVRDEVRRFDPGIPAYDVRAMAEIMSASIGRERFSSFILTVFSGVALLLAAIGIFSVVSYSVSRRTRETGVRIALGAVPRDILLMVVRQAMRPVWIGLGVGLVAAVVLARGLANLLFGVRTTDPFTLAAVILVLASISILACYLPARRATRVDPAIALRWE
jgi:putative ABC transport system permease protein